MINRLKNVLSPPLALAALALLLGGCSIERLAINRVADMLSEGGDLYTSDDDPELIGDALPFALKMTEMLLAKTPDHEGLLLSACQGFTQYGYAWVELEAMRLEPVDYRGAKRQRARALRLYLRGRGYCFRALDLKVPGTSERLVTEPEAAVAAFGKDDVPLLVWSGAAWGAAISLGLDRPELVVDVPSVRALLERALELDPDYDKGTLQEAMMAAEALPEAMGGSLERAREHYERALELHGGKRPSTYVSWAELVSIPKQDREEFVELLEKALALDPDDLDLRSERLVILITQDRARLLLQQIDDLFL